ncbi:MAG: hypothetical protein K2H76_02785 [Muribaculaceae bacterium]|nr:hypothetical protein [Muribaculaceae bacterium]MDE6026653.1 hypothetical protein [Muribaculaceae bacterium]
MNKSLYILVSAIVCLLLASFVVRPVMRAQTAGPGVRTSADSINAHPVDVDSVEDIVKGDSIIRQDSVAMGDSVVEKKLQRPNRSVTPVDVDDAKPTVVMHYYDKHGDPLPEPVMFLATLDTVVKPKSKPVYPLYNGVSVGVNFADAILMAAGQKYGSFDVWADVSLHNWFFPIIEAGIGFADSTPENSNYSYRTKPSFYTKLGINYNFLYKSNSDYQCFLGLRAGYSNFSYEVTDVNISSDYWGEHQTLNLKGLSGHSLFGEALAGIKVKIAKRFSLGWSIRYHFKFKTVSNSMSNPWFIPGYGASSPISFSLSAIYTFPGPGKIEGPENQ